MAFFPWWLSGLALASVMIVHWFLTQRMMAVSGRFTALVNRFRFGDEPEGEGAALTEEELMAAIQAATLEAFGEDLGEIEEESRREGPVAPAKDAEAPDGALSGSASGIAPGPPLDPVRPRAASPTMLDHLIFLGALPVGALVASALSSSFAPSKTLASPGFGSIFGDGLGALAALLAGGILVGFGTRMAGGCTSGHGLCGVSRLQGGSLLATAGFFGAGIAASFLLGAL